MPIGTVAGILALVVAVQAVDSRACSPPTPETPPAPTTPAPAPTVPASEVFTTADGVRFAVRIFDIASGSSEGALTLNDVYTESEAGLLCLALDPQFSQNRLVYLYQSARLVPMATCTAARTTVTAVEARHPVTTAFCGSCRPHSRRRANILRSLDLNAGGSRHVRRER